ncbi:MAG: filamentation induced by cAMP protein fic [Planctomycetes bacterium B3_Pla]|nr:MAG: filamentation induced by cAMP protein fic [Planctomycetes bacterium B3_Pla]
MKMPKKPPKQDVIWGEIRDNPERFFQIYELIKELPTAGRYLHWDKLRYHQPPEGYSHEEWWYALKRERQFLFKAIPLCDKNGILFKYLIADPIPEMLHKIDQGAGGFIRMPEPITNPDTKDQYYVSSLIQEAITSSQLEGAATTREIAKEMIKTGRAPCDKSEQMILNNFQTMRRIGRLKNEPLTRELVFHIHQIITEKTLRDKSATGRFRKANERIVVGDMYNEVFHDPPPAQKLKNRMAAMCDFANGKNTGDFIHPVIRSIILHFWLAYDHPFVDGNGRVARALFYWSMLRHGYWLFEFISISQIILKAPAKYGRAFLYTETDDNDLTYFILYHVDVIHRAIKELHEYIKHKTERLQAIERELRGVAGLNHRQRALISHALRHSHQRYTFKSHQISHNVVYQTARTDLLDLQDRVLLESNKIGKTWYFTPAKDLEKKLITLD